MYINFVAILSVDFGITDQLLIRYSTFITHLTKNANAMKQYISYSQTSRQPVIQLGGSFFL
jgi:hypothetical protein